MKPVIKKQRRPQINDEAGFTLLETAVSMVLLAIVGLGIASIFFFAAKNTVSASDRELAMAVAQQQMEQLRSASFTDTSLTATATDGVSTNVTRGGRRYVVLTTIANSNTINGTARTKTITVKVTPWSDGTQWSRNVSSVFGSVTLVAERSSLILGPNRQF